MMRDQQIFSFLTVLTGINVFLVFVFYSFCVLIIKIICTYDFGRDGVPCPNYVI